MPPSLKEIERLGQLKAQSITRQQSDLLSTSKKVDSDLYRFVSSKILPKFTFDASGRVTNSNANINASRNIKQLSDYMKGTVDRRMKDFYVGAAKSSIEASNRYYSLFKPKKALVKAINNKSNVMAKRLIIGIFTQSNVQTQIENVLGTAVMGTVKERDLENSIKDLITGKEDRMGLNEKFHYQNGHNVIRSQGRAIDSTFAKALELNYAIWTGGEIKTTREFCAERNGKVFLKEEIEAMEQLEWTGKKQFHVMLSDCGGYNCRLLCLD
ncbi:MAG: hypothetical protein ACRBFS_19515 [Aureispira sp.]